jgi:hypothetical protein
MPTETQATSAAFEPPAAPAPGAVTNDPISGAEATAASDPVPATPALDLQSPAPPPAPERTEDTGARTSEDIPVVDLTEDELARYAPDMVAAQQLQLKIERIYGAGSNPGNAGSDRPSSPDPGASAIKAILPRPPQALPPAGQVVRAPPEGC